eukprot:CAMPEP_0174843144 /NCGR_PEP_ID=MMETSP1114-20130205/10340_1 /TAXON_ID=312471 /ORGANISM="Neobodo designis, Strain CCAP 1951/1" /LENGTH=305 /DNA_ID=CAMNT_0016077357 /DNA_START=93 /DNA_END=1010 /DNA_ORIENTATION=-
MASRADEAAKLLKEGKKASEKGFFKKPKWDDAADAFDKAAKIYMNVADVNGAKEAATLAADAHAKAGNLFHAANTLDTFATFLKNNNKEDECPKVYVQAARYYAMANKPQNQADALSKAAKCVPKEESASAIEWMQEGITALEDAERWHVIKDPYRALVTLQVRADKVAEAIQTEKKYMAALAKADFPELAAKCGLEIVIMCLHLGDHVLAEREFQTMSAEGFGFPHSPEQKIAYELIDASEQRDAARLQEAGKQQRITFLIADIARMAKKLAVPSGAPPPRKPAALGGGMAAADDEPEDDEDVR